VIEGELNLVIEGVGEKKLAAGEGFQVPTGVPTAARAATSR